MIEAVARPGAGDETIWDLLDDDVAVGTATTVARRSGPMLKVLNVPLTDAAPALVGVQSAARQAGEEVLLVDVASGDEVMAAALAGQDTRLVSTQMRLDLDAPVTEPPRVRLRPMSADAFTGYRGQIVTAYAQDLFDAGAFTELPDALAASELSTKELLPDGVDSPGHHLWMAYAADTVVGILWIHVDGERAYIYDIEVTPEQRRRGYGRELLDAGARAATALGAAYIGLNVFGFNQGAQALYATAGYTITEQTFRLAL
ncbi:MAG: GNAT family N-acetyltransferase [Nocardioides sp.]